MFYNEFVADVACGDIVLTIVKSYSDRLCVYLGIIKTCAYAVRINYNVGLAFARQIVDNLIFRGGGGGGGIFLLFFFFFFFFF